MTAAVKLDARAHLIVLLGGEPACNAVR